MKVMSVLHLRPRKLGSFEEYTICLSRSLTARGGESVLVFKEDPPPELRPAYVDAGAVLEAKSFEPFGRGSAAELRSLVRRHRPDVVHFHFVNLLSLDVMAAGLSRGTHVVYSDHTSDPEKSRSALKWTALRATRWGCSLLVDRFVAPSEYVNQRLVREGTRARQVTTILNGVNLEKLRRVERGADIRSKYRLPRDSMLVASIAKLIPEKGIGYLIEAAALARDRGANVSFIHVGDGPCTDRYRARVHELGLDDRFVFAGLLNLPEIAAILGDSDIFSLPCTWGEAFSLVILEALAAGKPAIVTSVGGNPEAVENGRNGLVVPPHQPQALADAILSLHDDPARRRAMSEAAAARSSYFSVNRWVDQTIDLYESVVSS